MNSDVGTGLSPVFGVFDGVAVSEHEHVFGDRAYHCCNLSTVVSESVAVAFGPTCEVVGDCSALGWELKELSKLSLLSHCPPLELVAILEHVFDGVAEPGFAELEDPVLVSSLVPGKLDDFADFDDVVE